MKNKQPQKYISTWLCADEPGEESNYPQVGGNSSEFEVQKIYWRCVMVFFASSIRYHQEGYKHVFFTNVKELPEVDGVNIQDELEKLGVEIRYVKFTYKTPPQYYHSWRNQFYEFSIIDDLAKSAQDNDLWLLLDSDCVFVKSADELFNKGEKSGHLLLSPNYPVDYDINGLTRLQMKEIYEELLGRKINEAPEYHAGEFLFLNGDYLKKISKEFETLWPELLRRHEAGLPKLNEEAHTLSYIYYLMGLESGGANGIIKQLWTDKNTFRNVEPANFDLAIWHLPAEKRVGFATLFEELSKRGFDWFTKLNEQGYVQYLGKQLSVSGLSAKRQTEYRKDKTWYKVLRKIKKSIIG